MTNLARHLIYNGHDGRLTFRFPNGVEVSVIPDPRHLLCWEILVRTVDRQPVAVEGLGMDGLAAGLTTEQVEAKLAEVAALPAAEAEVAS